MKQRLVYLDYLRGLAALSIMVYHYFTWSYGYQTSDSFLGRIGVYGVSIFYILSGLTLYKVYINSLTLNVSGLLDFFRKRFFRIYPLLTVVTVLTVILHKQMPDWYKLFINLTGLFGLFKWNSHIAIGAWSIGNELVFYILFPFLIWFARTNRFLFYAAEIMLLIIYLYFAFIIITPNQPISAQTYYYMNPLNQAFLFSSGVMIGYVAENFRTSTFVTLILLITSIVLFNIYPTHSYNATLIYGADRIVFTILAITICFSFYQLSYELPYVLDRPLSRLGEATYSVYLLHPLVWSSFLLVKKIIAIPPAATMLLACTATVIVSHYNYNWFEKYFMNIGRKQV